MTDAVLKNCPVIVAQQKALHHHHHHLPNMSHIIGSIIVETVRSFYFSSPNRLVPPSRPSEGFSEVRPPWGRSVRHLLSKSNGW